MMKSKNKTGIPLITMISIRDQEARVSEKKLGLDEIKI